jgi:hypothetical protein
MRVKFTDEMLATLMRQQKAGSAAQEWLTRLQAAGMETQDEVRPGRINVRFRLAVTDAWSYRTYAKRDLVEVEA